MSMEQRNYLVTGVSRGLGIEIARALLEEEDVVVYGLSRSKPSELEALMARYPDRIRWMACDLGDSSNVRRVFKEFVGQGTPLHGYVNNAAMAYDDIVTNLNLERLRSMYEVNVFTPMMMVKGFIRHSLLHGVRGEHRAHLFHQRAYGLQGIGDVCLVEGSAGGLLQGYG